MEKYVNALETIGNSPYMDKSSKRFCCHGVLITATHDPDIDIEQYEKLEEMFDEMFKK